MVKWHRRQILVRSLHSYSIGRGSEISRYYGITNHNRLQVSTMACTDYECISIPCTGDQHSQPLRYSETHRFESMESSKKAPPTQTPRSSLFFSGLKGRPPTTDWFSWVKPRLRHTPLWMPVSRHCMQMQHWSVFSGHSALSRVI